MRKKLLQDYPHLEFRRMWNLSEMTLVNLGQCSALCEFIRKMPIDPNVQKKLRSVSFRRGAQATTAIEGNTLTDDELKQILSGKEIPRSREYQAKEVKNALEAMNFVWNTVVNDGNSDLISPRLLCKMNRLVGQGLGKLYDGVPGRFRKDRRHVGRYLAPPPEIVEELVDKFCEWLRHEFGFGRVKQNMHDAIVEAVVAHVFFEWIHPFADGNGRTGRLVEFFILLRGGLPDVAAHVLANHYNTTRPEYSAHFDEARNTRNMSGFIDYAVQGMLDGLKETVDLIQADTWRVVRRSHIYDVFSDYTDYKKKNVFKRRRELALAMTPEPVTPEGLIIHSESLVGQYINMDRRTLIGDLNVLVDLGLVEKTEDGKYFLSMGSLGAHIVSHV